MEKQSFRPARSGMLVLVMSCLVFFGAAAVWAQDTEDEATADTGIRSVTIDQSVVVPTVVPDPDSEMGDQVRDQHEMRAGSPLRGLWVFPKMTHKLWRGGNNVLFGWVEIPKGILVDSIQVGEPFTGVITGLVFGSAKAIERTGVGAIEMLTFWHEWPQEYKAVIQPEFVLDDFQD